MPDLDPLSADLTPKDAARLLPGRPNHMTVWRWMTRGIKGIRLESVIVAGSRRTSLDALRRFLQVTTAAADGVCPPQRSSQRKREKEMSAAIQELNEAGL